MSAASTFNVTVNDTQAPTLTCPANVGASSPGGAPIPVTYTVPTATDNCGSPTVTCLPASGSNFPVGATTVTCTASDASASSPDATCSFTVSVSQFTPVLTETLTNSLPNSQPGDVVTGSFSVPNATNAPQTGTVMLNLPAGLLGLPGKCVTNIGGTCVVTTTQVMWRAVLCQQHPACRRACQLLPPERD